METPRTRTHTQSPGRRASLHTEHRLELDDQLPVGLRHLVLEVLLQLVDAAARNLNEDRQNGGDKEG